MADGLDEPPPRGHRWLEHFLDRHGLRVLEDATPEQYEEWLAGHNELRAERGFPPLASGAHGVAEPHRWGPQTDHGDDLVEAPRPVGVSYRGDPVSPEAEALSVEESRWQFEFVTRHGLLSMDDATPEQHFKYVAGANEIRVRYGVPPLS